MELSARILENKFDLNDDLFVTEEHIDLVSAGTNLIEVLLFNP